MALMRVLLLALAASSAAVPPPARAASAVAVHSVRVNTQRPSWSNACPPPEDNVAASRDGAAPPCRRAAESQGLPTTELRLTWELRGGDGHRGLVQTEHETEIVCVATGRTLWRGNATGSSGFAAVALPEPELAAESSFAARVRARWVSAGGAFPTWTEWSEAALFDTAPSAGSWAARDSEWIGGDNQLRSDFALPAAAAVRRARLHAIGLGAFVISLNGQRLGDHILDPPQTAYPSRALYSSWNVTQRLRSGSNVLGVLLGRYKYGYVSPRRTLLIPSRSLADNPAPLADGRLVQPDRCQPRRDRMPLLPHAARRRAGRRQRRDAREQQPADGGEVVWAAGTDRV